MSRPIVPQMPPYLNAARTPANVITTVGVPSATFVDNPIGTIAVSPSTSAMYGLVKTTSTVATWVLLGGDSSSVDTINNLLPAAGNITIAGTANQVGVANAGSTVTLSLPAAVLAPGTLASTSTITAGTSITATAGAITATNGNLVLGTAGNKIVIATGANASVGTSAAMTTGAVTVATTASSATAKIFYVRATTGGTTGDVAISAQNGAGFTLTSTSATETSTFNWWIINA